MPSFAATLVVAVVALPPPLNGQTAVNEGVIEDLVGSGVQLHVVDTSPRGHQRGLAYHIRRIAIVCTVPFVLLTNLSHSDRRLYTVVEPGHGMVYNFLVVGFARLFRYEMFLHHHSSSYVKHCDRRFWALSALAGSGAVHIVLSQEMASDLTALYRFCVRTLIVGNACRVPDPGMSPSAGRFSPLKIGFLSNLSLEKGLDTVLESFEAIRDAGIQAKLIIAGPVIDKRARALLQDAHVQLDGAIAELGSVYGDAKAEFFASIDVFVFPSRYRNEAQPLVVLEALSYGVPVLVTRHGYCAELVGPLGTTVEPPGFAGLALEFLRRFADVPQFACNQRAAARARYVELAESSRAENNSLVQMLSRSAERNPWWH
jgi:glycosyltransferase involved in cell wall biosynthesis